MSISALEHFHPAVRAWFLSRFESPTEPQRKAWSEIRTSENVLVAAPTGSGKTLAAFLCAISDLVEQAEHSPLQDALQVLYVSPLKALSNDIERNLREPLAGIDACLERSGASASGLRAMVRTGDTPPGERAAMRKRAPHILVTTPESLYLLLTSASGRDMLSTTRTVIIDEIHAVAATKRGSHLSLSLARLDALCEVAPSRIGLSATQKPIEYVARFLAADRSCSVVDAGHRRTMDVQLETVSSPLSPVMSNEVWTEVYDRLAQLVEVHATTLVFVNTRRLAERVARHLSERIGQDLVTAHHGSLSRAHRLEAEQALKSGQLKALVATASLELGIDIGNVDLVCQLGSPGSIAAFLQRVGRSGHRLGDTPKGRLFPLSRDDLVECVALLKATNAGELDLLKIPDAPLDVLAQQLVAELSARDWDEDGLFQLVRSAFPYRAIEMEEFISVVQMLSEGYASRRGRRSAYVFHDRVNRKLRARPAARIVALQNGGAIPDHFDYEVILLPQGHRVGSLNEDFAFDSLPGDIFQLGNTSYRILKVEQGRVLVEDAAGQPPTIPFWFGDRPGRSDALSQAVSDLRSWVESVLNEHGPDHVISSLCAQGIQAAAAEQLTEYLHAAYVALGALPTAEQVIVERFFDDTGDMHLVIHAPLGSRLMRAWGLALRKRFCRTFNFELQAAALEDSLILSLGETHSFELESVMAYLNSTTVREVLIQALLDAPMFEVRWRWNATIALAVQRMRNGQKLPPQWQRNQAEDLVSVVFPDQLACLENIHGAREIPDHPLVQQTVSDCLHETMDIDGLEMILQLLESGKINTRCVELTSVSPLSREIINARPYAFLDDGDAENRRTRAIRQSPDDLSHAAQMGFISPSASDQVREEAWIRPRSADELHDGLLQLGFLTSEEFSSGNSGTGAPGDASQWAAWFKSLSEEMRACCMHGSGQSPVWVATERLAEWHALHPNHVARPDVRHVLPSAAAWNAEEALHSLLRDRLAGLGPVTVRQLAADFHCPDTRIEMALSRLEGQGFAIVMDAGKGERLWCERRLLARIHRYSRQRRRRNVQPSSPRSFMRFLYRWHGMQDGAAEIEQVLSQLEGWAAPVAQWEQFILPRRSDSFSPSDLDQQFLSGRQAWFRPVVGDSQAQRVVSATPIAIVPREQLSVWRGGGLAHGEPEHGYARAVLEILHRRGAMFASDLESESGLLRPQLEQALSTLVCEGRVSADAFSPLRWILRPEVQKARIEKRFRSAAVLPVGRWSLLPDGEIHEAQPLGPGMTDQARLAAVCLALLRRYGVVFRAVLARETLIPSWRYLLQYFRRMEDRGEVRGGRFIDGFSGEQFALPEAAGLLRQCNEPDHNPRLVVISASDPLNLGGIVVPGPKTPALVGNRILLEDGLPAARVSGQHIEPLPGASDQALHYAEETLRVVTPWRNRR